jgi:hypothetical protein
MGSLQSTKYEKEIKRVKITLECIAMPNMHQRDCPVSTDIKCRRDQQVMKA